MQERSRTAPLENIPLFSGLSDAELATLEQHTTTRIYPRNTIVINEGDEGSALYVLISGQVKVYLSNEEGKEIIVNTLGPGEYFGELALLDNTPRSASVMTTCKSRLAMVSKADFKHVLSCHPSIALNLIMQLAGKIRILSENVRSLALLDVYGRVAKTLLDMATEEDGKLIVKERMTQQDIANHVGASREMVARIMKDLVTGGYITLDRKHIVINEKLPEHY